MKKSFLFSLALCMLILLNGCSLSLKRSENFDRLIIQHQDGVLEISDSEAIQAWLSVLFPLSRTGALKDTGFQEETRIYCYSNGLQLRSFLFDKTHLYTRGKTYALKEADYKSLTDLFSPYASQCKKIQPDYAPDQKSSFERLPLEKALLGEYAAALYFSSNNPNDRAHAHFEFTERQLIQCDQAFFYRIEAQSQNALLLFVYQDSDFKNQLFQMRIYFDAQRKAMTYEKLFQSFGPAQYFPEKLVRLCDKGPILSYVQFNHPFFFEAEQTAFKP